MNSLSPIGISSKQFNARLKFMKNRNVDHVNLFICDYKDCCPTSGTYDGIGYGPKYEKPFSIYGADFNHTGAMNQDYVKIMDSRINQILNAGLNVVLWMAADDSLNLQTNRDWNKELADPEVFTKMCADIDSLGWFQKAAAIVVGLECNEYWDLEIVQQNCDILRNFCSGKIGVHTTSVNEFYGDSAYRMIIPYLNVGDIAFVQVEPRAYTEDEFVNVITTTREMLGELRGFDPNAVDYEEKLRNIPLSMFETYRNCHSTNSQRALNAGADSVGNW